MEENRQNDKDKIHYLTSQLDYFLPKNSNHTTDKNKFILNQFNSNLNSLYKLKISKFINNFENITNLLMTTFEKIKYKKNIDENENKKSIKHLKNKNLDKLTEIEINELEEFYLKVAN